MTNDSRQARIISAAAFILAVGAAIFLRFYDLAIKPLHHDEGVNSFFLLNLARSGQYAYNPENFHGPTLYYFSLALLKLMGESEVMLRTWPALCGVASVAIIWLLRRWLGIVGTPATAWALALSPGLVYYSRDFIHEMSFGLFTVGIVVGAWRYFATKRFVWMVLLSVSAGLLFATKETALHTVAVLVAAIFCAMVWDIGRRQIVERRFGIGRFFSEFWTDLTKNVRTLHFIVFACWSVWDVWRRPTEKRRNPIRFFLDWWQQISKQLPDIDYLISALVIFLAINVIFYSSFFTNWKGVTDAVKSIFLWTSRGSHGDEHAHAFVYYIGILIKLELPLVVGSIIGGLIALWRGTRFGLFLFAWASGITIGYSIVRYKTPWLALSMFIPMAMLTGYAIQEVYSLLRSGVLRVVWIAAVLLAAIPCARMAWDVNLKLYDDNNNTRGYFKSIGERLKLRAYSDTQYGYVYAQTDRNILDLVKVVNDVADKQLDPNLSIHIASPEYWPLPWYFRNYQIVGFGTVPGENFSLPVLISSITQEPEISAQFADSYTSDIYTLRPGVQLVLFVKR
ncbi:MAG TPA: flippase activity-associated protein Agl23 [Blastocatellia bacterium]|nr:flippase activity-associated protein Agl23 [Blastocatellia bacterium]